MCFDFPTPPIDQSVVRSCVKGRAECGPRHDLKLGRAAEAEELNGGWGVRQNGSQLFHVLRVRTMTLILSVGGLRHPKADVIELTC